MQEPETETKERTPQKIIDSLAIELGCPILLLNDVFYDDEQSTFLALNILKSGSDIIKEFGRLSVVIESSGGQLEPFFRILKTVRQNAEIVNALVPHRAKSAATFFCLGVDEIYMGLDGELGPLDAQIHDPKGGSTPISPLETFHALEELRKYSLETSWLTLDFVVTQLMQRTHMDVPYAVERAMQLVSAIAGSIYSRVDPHELGQMGRHLLVSERYADTVMRRWSYKDLTDDDRRSIIDRLVRDYPTHGFVIDFEEAQEIGLKVKPLDDEISALCEELIENADTPVLLGSPIGKRNEQRDESTITEQDKPNDNYKEDQKTVANARKEESNSNSIDEASRKAHAS